MASSSFSPADISTQLKYDVFLSFSGEDTRDSFTSHLYAALCRKKIETFIDNQLIRGEEISPSLLDAIERSKILVVIFSKGYASSRWCLEELVKILECKDKYGHIVIPVFYHVDPSNVRNQTGNFGDAFSKLEERFLGRVDKLQRWRIALREAANISGFNSHVVRPESVLIEEIVKEVLKRLNDIFPSAGKDQLVGAESRIREIELLLRSRSKGVYILGIWGIGGIGKTTIASAVFSKNSSDFDGSYFIENVREESEQTRGLVRQKLRSILEDGNVSLKILSNRINFGNKRPSHRKVLIVLDDVSSFEQIEFLIGSLDRFISESRVIITTRDKQVLKNCGVDNIYEVKELFDDDALKLFSQYAFGRNHPDVGYLEPSNQILKYVKGVPLALKILGCFLCGRRKEEWGSAINKLKRIPHKDIQKVLKVSYDGLDDEERNIFLDIACFFKGEDRDFVIKFLDVSGFSAEIGISVLVDKCLIIIRNNKIMMHDLLQEMGREIVRQESIRDPGNRSRLWDHEDVRNVLTKNTGTEAVEGISLDMSKVKEIHLNARTFSKMNKLRFFKFYCSRYGENMNKVHNFQGVESGFNEQRYFEWHGCPLKSLSSNMKPENLVSLEMPHSSIRQLWNGVQELVNLKRINLSHSKHLTEIPDLSKATNLESLHFQGCSSLVETHSSIQYLNRLVVLNLRGCRSLVSLSTSIHLKSLKRLDLCDCSNLKEFPELSCNIKQLDLCGTAIKEVPASIEHLSCLVMLLLRNCSRLEGLPSQICKLKCLQRLDVSGCSNLERLPDELGNLEALEDLSAGRTAIREVPSSIVCLKNLDDLWLERLLPSVFGLTSLALLRLTDFGIRELPENLGQLSLLEELVLDKNDFERIPESIRNLSKLSLLSLNYCEMLQSLPELPCGISELRARSCSSLETLSGLSILFAQPPPGLQIFDFLYCFKLDQNELKEIIKDAQMKFEATYRLAEREKEKCEFLAYSILYPGSELPEWFMFQSIGSSVTLELPPGSDNFVGFAVCCVFAFRDIDNGGCDFSIEYECKLKTEDGLSRVFTGCCRDMFYPPAGPIHDGSDHIFLDLNVALFIEDFDETYNEAFVQFRPLDLCIDCCEVTKCGVHLLYAQDFGASKKESRRSGESTEESSGSFSSDEEEGLPQPKRLKFSVKNVIPWGSIVCPGNELPEWFTFQSIGPSITFKLPAGWFCDNFVGFALCAIVTFRDYFDDGLHFRVANSKLKMVSVVFFLAVWMVGVMVVLVLIMLDRITFSWRLISEHL